MNIELLNMLIFTAMVEVFIIAYGSIAFKYLFCIPIKKIKYVVIWLFLFVFTKNMYLEYVKYMGTFGKRQGLVVALLTYTGVFGLYAVCMFSSEKELLKIMLANFILEITTVAVIALPFIAISQLLHNDNTLFTQNGLNVKCLLIYLLEMVVSAIIVYFAYLILKKYAHVFNEWKIKHRKIFWIIATGELVYGIVTEMDMGKDLIVTYFEMSYALVLGVGLYALSVWLRNRREKQIGMENEMLNVENHEMKEHYQKLESQMEKTRKFRHDIDKHMVVIKELVEEQGTVEDAQNYAAQVEKEYRDL